LAALIANSLEGFDLHVVTLVNEGEEPTAESINGLIIFN